MNKKGPKAPVCEYDCPACKKAARDGGQVLITTTWKMTPQFGEVLNGLAKEAGLAPSVYVAALVASRKSFARVVPVNDAGVPEVKTKAKLPTVKVTGEKSGVKSAKLYPDTRDLLEQAGLDKGLANAMGSVIRGVILEAYAKSLKK